MSLEEELRSEKVIHLDLTDFSRVQSGTPVCDVLIQTRSEKHNVCLVVSGEDLIGIFTDRDVLTRVAGNPETLDKPIDKVMTPNPITISPDASAADALRLMDDNHVRNLPAVDVDGHIVGNMTHHTIINYLASRYPVEVLNRPFKYDRFPRKAEGG